MAGVPSSSRSGGGAVTIATTTITANVNLTGTTEGTATTVISPGAVTFSGAAVWVEFYCPGLVPPGGAPGDTSIVGLFESGTLINRFCFVQNNVTNQAIIVSGYGKFRFTPSAVAHTYVVAGWVTNTTNTPKVVAGVGGAGVNPPAYVHFMYE